MAPHDLHYRINIHALPNQQRVVICLMALVVFGTLLAIGYNTPPLLYWGLACFLFIYCLREILALLEREQRQFRLTPSGDTFLILQHQIDAFSKELALTYPPRLMISHTPSPPRVLTTWRRHYVVMDMQRAIELQSYLDIPSKRSAVHAVLRHELCHLANNDHLWLTFAQMLLKSGRTIIVWFSLALVAFVLFLGLIYQSFFTTFTPATITLIANVYAPGTGDMLVEQLFGSREEFERVAAEARTIDFSQLLFNAVANSLPYILIGELLLLGFWNRLLRLREAYADLRAVQLEHNTEGLIKALLLVGLTSEKDKPFTQRLVDKLRYALLGSVPTYYLQPNQRIAALQKPEILNGTPWSYGVTTGLLIAGLNMLISSTSALAFVGSWPLHFPFIASVVLLSLFLLTHITLGSSIRRTAIIVTITALGTYSAFIMATLVLLLILAIVNPIVLTDLFESSARNIAGYARIAPTPVLQDPVGFVGMLAWISLAQILVLFTLCGLTLWFVSITMRRMLAWYRLPQAEQRLMSSIYIAIACIVAFVSIVVLPLITEIILRPNEPFSLGSTQYMALAGTIVLGGLSIALWFGVLDYRFGRRCPQCSAHIDLPFTIAAHCPTCAVKLHPWLATQYSVGH